MEYQILNYLGIRYCNSFTPQNTDVILSSQCVDRVTNTIFHLTFFSENNITYFRLSLNFSVLRLPINVLSLCYAMLASCSRSWKY